MVAVGNDSMWQRFAPVIGLPELAGDPRFATNPDRVVNRAELIPLIEAALQARGSAEWAEEMSGAGIPAGAINTVDRALAQPQVAARDMVLTTEHPTAGTVRMAGSPVRLSHHSATVRRPPPLLGEHTDEVLAEIGYSAADVAAMRERGLVR
jgi:crotonobetainyl-CoA:carnitine CoA-transferase CaiB-like acyl-CoA transferase